MATPADQRLLELLNKWLNSLELHLKYSALDDASYSKIQNWVEHQRPSRWIIDLARQKALALKAQVEERIKMGDAKFSDSLELMIFLGNLLAAEHIERFIPLADADTEQGLPLEPPQGQTVVNAVAATATREMPRFVIPPPRAAPLPAGAPPTADIPVVAPLRTHASGSKGAAAAPAKAAKHAKPAKPAAPSKTQPKSQERTTALRAHPVPQAQTAVRAERASGISDAAREQVIADAARLVQWGRKWYELAELISRMADRPALPDVRRILKDNKTAIDEKAGRS